MNARSEFRLDEDDKALIERAAATAGVSVSAFQRTVVVRAAREFLREAEAVTLDRAAAERFMEALSQPFEPNEALRRALARNAKLGA